MNGNTLNEWDFPTLFAFGEWLNANGEWRKGGHFRPEWHPSHVAEWMDFSECLVLCATASGSGSNLNASAADSEDGLGVTHSTNFTGIMPQAVNRDWQGAVPVLLITIS